MAMKLRLTHILALVLLAPGVQAAPAGLPLPQGAVESGVHMADPASVDLPQAGFDGQNVPMRRAEGRLDQRAYRIAGSRQTTLALLQPMQAQLEASGWTVAFTCETVACGGFDFRYAMDVLPEPDMHVDLGDFRYLLAENASGGLIGLLVSRSLDQGFVQVTVVLPSEPLPDTPTDPASVASPPQPEVTPQPEAPALPETALPAPVVLEGLVQRLEGQGSASLDDLVFASGKAALEAGEYASLGALAEWLKANPTARVTLVGHTDATGSLQGNIALSRARAEAVRDRLVSGLAADGARIAAEGAGYLAPRASNQTPEGRQANRRVEVVVTSVGTE